MYALVDTQHMQKLDITLSERRVIDYVLTNTNMESTEAVIMASGMAKELGWSNSFAARQLRVLVERHILIDCGPKTYRVNAFLGYRGAGGKPDWNEQTLMDPEPLWEKP